MATLTYTCSAFYSQLMELCNQLDGQHVLQYLVIGLVSVEEAHLLGYFAHLEMQET